MIRKRKTSITIWTVAVLLTLLIAVVVYYVARETAITSSAMRPATCFATHCFCEAPRSRGLVQPVDTVSSLAGVLLGVFALVRYRRSNFAVFRERSLFAIYGVVLIFIGASSFYYHATLSFNGQFLDIFSMYAYGTLLTIAALYRSARLTWKQSLIIFIIANIALAMVQYQYPEARRYLFALLLLPGLVLESLKGVAGSSLRDRPSRYLLIGIGIMAIAYGFWLLDQYGLLCASNSWFQGHAVWHVLSAVAAFSIIGHYRSTLHPVRLGTQK